MPGQTQLKTLSNAAASKANISAFLRTNPLDITLAGTPACKGIQAFVVIGLMINKLKTPLYMRFSH
jgi:hypothetical protein